VSGGVGKVDRMKRGEVLEKERNNWYKVRERGRQREEGEGTVDQDRS